MLHQVAKAQAIKIAKVLAVKDLPQVFKDALKDVGYFSRTISVKVTTSVGSPVADDGMKPFMVAVDLNEGRYKVNWGSWGQGSGKSVNIPNGGAVIAGQSRVTRDAFAIIYVTPANVAKLLEDESGEDLSDHEDEMLYLIKGIKSGYRASEMERRGIPGGYSVKNSIILSLVEKGLAKANSAGAIQITLKGKNQPLRTRW